MYNYLPKTNETIFNIHIMSKRQSYYNILCMGILTNTRDHRQKIQFDYSKIL